jgi:hypothetical protein
MLKVDAVDQVIAPFLDRILDRMNLGFIMTVVATKENANAN